MISRAALKREIASRGFHRDYRANEANLCPGCGRQHWLVGRTLAECAFCGTAMPLAPASSVKLGSVQ